MAKSRQEVLDILGGMVSLSSTAIDQLDQYVELLERWNRQVNLVADSTIDQLWQRHILDCAQLWPHISGNTSCLTDFGSGAGLPVITLAILNQEHACIQTIHAIESVTKKTNFMREAARILGLDIQIHNARIEDLKPWKSDIITARAFANVGDILGYAQPFLQKESLCLLLKGCKAKNEIAAAEEMWEFSCQLSPSLSGGEGAVVTLHNIRRREHE